MRRPSAATQATRTATTRRILPARAVHRPAAPRTRRSSLVLSGCLLHFEMQATRGAGRIVSLGSMQKVMKESVAAAAQFIKTHAKDIGLPGDWQDNFDIAVLATMMGVPK